MRRKWCRRRRSVRGGAHACLIREQTTLYAVNHGLCHTITDSTGNRFLQSESTFDNQHKNFRQAFRIMSHHPKGENEIRNRHHRHHQLRHPGNGAQAAENDHTTDNHQTGTDITGIRAKGHFGRLSNRVCLNGIKDQSECDNQED